MKRTSVFAALLFATGPILGCSGNGLLPAGGLTADAPVAETTSADDRATDAAPTPTKVAGGFNPFDAPPSVPAGGREVIANPTIAEVMQTGPLPEMSFGRPDAPVTIIQYASLTCPHCRHFHKETFPAFKRAYIDTGKVRYILREFPIGHTSGAATIALRCAKPEKYLELYGKFMDQQPAWVSLEVRLDPIYKVASQVGMTRQQFDACRENQAMIEGLKWVKERGRKLGIIGTPNFFVQGKLVKKELTLAEIGEMVAAADRPATTASGATH